MTGKPRKCINHGRVRWYVDTTDPVTGKRTRPCFPTQAAAMAYQAQVNTQPLGVQRPALADPDVTVERFAADWLCTQIAAGVWTRPGTVHAYREHLWLRICGFRLGARQTVGTMRVRDLQRAHVGALVAGMRQDGFAPRTTAATYRLLSQLLDRAVSAQLLPQHPVDRDFWRTVLKPLLRTPKDETTVKAFTEAQAQAFLSVTRQHSRLHDLYVTGFLTGCRLGELCGLQLDDVQANLVDGRRVHQLQVARSLARGSTSRPVTGPTKSGKTRWVDVGTDLQTVLDRLTRERPGLAMRRGWRPVPPWCFVTRTGRPLDQTVVQRDFVRMLGLAGLVATGFSPHSMRHSFATWHIVRGQNAKWVQQQLGHASIGITLDLYADWFTLSDAQAADSLGRALVGSELAAKPVF